MENKEPKTSRKGRKKAIAAGLAAAGALGAYAVSQMSGEPMIPLNQQGCADEKTEIQKPDSGQIAMQRKQVRSVISSTTHGDQVGVTPDIADSGSSDEEVEKSLLEDTMRILKNMPHYNNRYNDDIIRAIKETKPSTSERHEALTRVDEDNADRYNAVMIPGIEGHPPSIHVSRGNYPIIDDLTANTSTGRLNMSIFCGNSYSVGLSGVEPYKIPEIIRECESLQRQYRDAVNAESKRYEELDSQAGEDADDAWNRRFEDHNRTRDQIERSYRNFMRETLRKYGTPEGNADENLDSE